MKELTATFRIVTPMFIGGADQSPSDGIRPPSVKGALRFWWRALNWGRFCTEPHDEVASLKALHAEEARLFGSNATGNKQKPGGQGVFLLSVTQQPSIEAIPIWNSDEAKYLAFGLDDRKAIKEGGGFSLRLVFKPGSSDDDIKQLSKALEVWGLLGGLGGRSRRAMGSISLNKLQVVDMELQGVDIAKSKEDYEEKVETLISSFKGVPQAPFTAFSQDSLFCIMGDNDDSRKLVERIGNQYKKFRSNGEKDEDAKKAFKKEKEAFGKSNPRRASPVFFHIHRLEDTCIANSLFLPATIFHHEEPTMSMDIVKKFIAQGETNV